jgi:uncharacterized protein YqhQ
MSQNGHSAPSGKGAVLQYGGQAVIEGVMMRSPRFFAVACRKPNGEIVVQREEVDKSILGKLKWLNVAFLRGTLALIDAMALGSRALAFASHVQLEAEQAAHRNGAAAAALNENATPLGAAARELEMVAASAANGPVVAPVTGGSRGKINEIQVGGSLLFGLAFGLLLFVLLPTWITGALRHGVPAVAHTAHPDRWLNIADGVIKMVIFFGYIGLISLMPQIRRVFMYHGAEHKAINTLEAGLPLTRANALSASRIHPRCGTSFIFIVLVINLIVFAFLPRPENIAVRFLLHMAVIPLVAGISYEVIRFAGHFRRFPVVMAVFAPGMWSQYLTTREPDSTQVEVALAALYSVLEAEGHLTVAGADGAAPNPLEPETVTA